jgi:hypothetical protein
VDEPSVSSSHRQNDTNGYQYGG